jgi:phosphoribosylamine--glycine ligase
MIWQEAKEELRNMLVHRNLAASTKVVIEEFLDGIELSCLFLPTVKATKYFQQQRL